MAKKLIQVVYVVNDSALLKSKDAIAANEAAAKKADDQVKKFGQSSKTAGDGASKSFLNLGNVWKGLLAIGITAFVANLAKKTFDLGVKQEQLNIAFTTFLGSAERARKLLAELNKFALVTPFTPDQVNAAAKSLLAFGIEGEKIIPTLKLIGDVSAGTGKDLSEMAIIFGQIKSTGRLMGQDLLQLINAGFNPLQVISEKTGKSVKLLKEEMEKGLVSFDMVEQAFKDATSAGGLFFNLMEAQSKTVGGLLSTVSGNIDEILKNIFSASSGPVKAFVETLVELSENFLRLSESQEQMLDRLKAEGAEIIITKFKDFAKAYENLTVAGGDRIKQLEEERESLRKLNSDWSKPLTDEEFAKSTKRLNQIMFEKKTIEDYLEVIRKGEEAEIAKKTTAELEKQAAALARLNKLRLEAKEEPLPGMDGPDKLSPLESAQRGLFGFTIDDALEAVEQLLQTQENAQNEQLALKLEGDKNEIDAEKKKQDQIKELKQQAFDVGVDLLGRALFFAIDAFAEEAEQKGKIMTEEEKKTAELRRRQAKKEQEVTIKKILIEGALNAAKALGLPPIPGANFVAAGIAAAQAIAAAAIVKSQGFKEGVIGINGPGTGTSDSIPVRVSHGESIIRADATSQSRELLTAINDRRIDDRILRKLKVSSGGVTVINDNKGVEQAIDRLKPLDPYQEGHFTYQRVKKGQTLIEHIKSKSH